MSLGKYYDEIDTILSSMIDYLGIQDDDYFEEDEEDDDLFDEPVCTMSDVEKFGAILESYLDSLVSASPAPTDEKILKAAERTVKQLNKLNEKCEYELIEPLLSDDVCQFIHNAAVEAGLSDIPESVADEWRDF